METHTHFQTSPPPEWSLALGTAAKGLIIAAIVLFGIATVLAITTGRGKKPFVAGSFCLFGSFAALATLFLTDQFHYSYVYGHSETVNGVGYKIAAIWSGQQGSFLLWGCCAALFGLLAIRSTGETYRRGYLIAFSVFLGTIAGILAYESPFNVQTFPNGHMPPEGIGLAPSLNNYWVIIHPPTIFLGFGSLSVLFAFAFAALLTKNYTEWAPRVRPWALVSLSLVGLGLCMGGFWAYETLGWGGFWKWDPVENASFVPWCLTAALVHGIIVQVTRGKWVFANVLLAGLPFLSFVYGTFLTRAGFLDQVSVHSFAQMDAGAHKVLLSFAGLSVFGFLGFWLFRWVRHRPEPSLLQTEGLHREAFYRYGLIFLLLLAAATAVGMSVPLIQAVMGRDAKVVEEHVYHLVLSWMFVPIMLFMAVTPFVSWRGMGFRTLMNRIINVISVTFGILGILLLVNAPKLTLDKANLIGFPGGFKVLPLPWIFFLAGICAFAAIANLWRLVEVWKRARPSSGAFLAHIGVAVTMAGLIVSRGFELRRSFVMQPGTPPAVGLEGQHPMVFLDYDESQRNNWFDRDNKVRIEVQTKNERYTATPGLYYAMTQDGQKGDPVMWPHIRRTPTHDLYLTMGPEIFQASEPLELAPGENGKLRYTDFNTYRDKELEITFDSLQREGEAGVSGTSFTAKVRLRTEDGERTLRPTKTIGEGRLIDQKADIDGYVQLAITQMDVASGKVQFQLDYVTPVFWAEMYFKPMTGLVWGGTGILTFGGLLSAWHRRRGRRVTSEATEDSAGEDPKDAETKDDALVPTA